MPHRPHGVSSPDRSGGGRRTGCRGRYPALGIRNRTSSVSPGPAVELVQVVVRDVERADVPLGLYNPRCPVLDGMVQQPVAHEVHQSVGRHARTVFSEKLRVRLDERDDVIDFLLLCLEAALSLLRHDELVATDTPSLAVQTDIRGIAQAVAPVRGGSPRQSARPECSAFAGSRRR